MFTKPRIGSIFISFVSFSFNKPHVSVPTRTCISVIGEIRVPNKFVLSALLPPCGQWAYGESRVQKNIECDPCTKNIFVLSELFVFKTSRESIEIHHWSIPHCGKPQQFNIQHSKLNIALRASVCKRIFVTFALLPPFGQCAYGESRVQKTVSAPPRTSIRESEIRVQK